MDLDDMIRNIFAALLAALAATLAGPAGAAPESLAFVPGEVVVADKASAPAPRLRITAKAAVSPARLAPVADAELETIRRQNRAPQGKRLMIGVNRAATVPQGTLPTAANVAWSKVDGGQAAQWSLASPDAAAVRLAIDLRGVPLDVEMVFFGSGSPGQLLGPVRVGDIADRSMPWWSPPTEGETQTVEVFVPGARDPKALGLRIAQVSHLFTSAASGFKKRIQDIGDSGSCNVDVPCFANPTQAFLNTRNAVAKMLFTIGAGSGLCTGTLLNDTDPSSQVPWFYTANHCFDNEVAPFKTPAQMQQVAGTLTTYWFFEAVACNNHTSIPPFVTHTGGATYVYGSQPSDVMFLRLNESPPAGAFLSGYSTQSFAASQTGTGIHHPQGDLKKVSQGTTLGFSTPFPGATSQAYTEIRWFSGTTEGGSSGSGLWSFDASQYLFRGGLWGGSALCNNLQGTDNFSRFDLAYPTLRQYLENAATPFADFTDLWWGGQGESGWGLNLVQHPSNQIFGVWYTYGADGKRVWIVMSGGQWLSSSQFTGPLYITSGPAYNAPFNPASMHLTNVGTGTLTFSSANAGTWSYTVNGVSGAKSITRQPF
jgi:hypothetical protein